MFPDAATRDLYYYEQQQATYHPLRCPECYKEFDFIYVWKGGYAPIECNCRIDRNWTDDRLEHFTCPQGCAIDDDVSTKVYSWKGSGIPLGCQHCIKEVSVDDNEFMEAL